MLAISRETGPSINGLLGALIISLGAKRGQALCAEAEAKLSRASNRTLRSKPNKVYMKSQLRSITLKSSKFAAPGFFITPDLILETTTGKKKFGISAEDFAPAGDQLQKMFPDIFKMV